MIARRTLIAVAAFLLIAPLHARAQDSAILNPTKRAYKDELIRLQKPVAPGDGASPFVVTQDGAEIPYQVERIDGKDWVWICSNFDPNSSHKYAIAPGKPKPAAPRVTLRREGHDYLLENGNVAVKVPAE